MVRQLNFPIEIYAVETKRDVDGLALSSRNQHLSAEDRKVALKLSATLFLIQKMAKGNCFCLNKMRSFFLLLEGLNPIECLDRAQKFISENSDHLKLDYLVIVEEETLKKIDRNDFKGKTLVMIAAWIGETRLIDNVFVEFSK